MEFEIRTTGEHAHRLELGRGALVAVFSIRNVTPDHVGPDTPTQHRHELNVQDDFFRRLHDGTPTKEIALLEGYDCHSTIAAARTLNSDCVSEATQCAPILRCASASSEIVRTLPAKFFSRTNK